MADFEGHTFSKPSTKEVAAISQVALAEKLAMT